jgi:hypothetical protein
MWWPPASARHSYGGTRTIDRRHDACVSPGLSRPTARTIQLVATSSELDPQPDGSPHAEVSVGDQAPRAIVYIQAIETAGVRKLESRLQARQREA